MMKLDRRQVNWALQRISRIIAIWKRLQWMDRQFLLRKFRDENPQDFWIVANEASTSRRNNAA